MLHKYTHMHTVYILTLLQPRRSPVRSIRSEGTSRRVTQIQEL